MKFARGSECYRADCPPVVAYGRTYSDDELSAALDGPVATTIRDDTGNDTIKNLLLGISETGFQHDSVRRILSHKKTPDDWRVGEAFAECHLRNHLGCSFPWPAGRDQKNPDSSPTGADLVGFQKTKQNTGAHRFAFGEVKTSTEKRWPPQVMYGRHGMTRQLESLRDDVAVKDHLVKYLAHRAHEENWESQYKEAAVRYLTDSTDVALFGVLVRDVEPKDDDLCTRAQTLASGCPDHTSIELAAVYFPIGSITGIGKRINLTEEGRHARN